MPYKQEIKTLQNLASLLCEQLNFSLKHLHNVDQAFQIYTAQLKKMHHREPDLFDNFLEYGLDEIDQHRKLMSYAGSGLQLQQCFSDYRQYLECAIADVIGTLKENNK